MSVGSLALVLHAHLPFVRHPEHAEFLEENWLFEAITETYVPLLAMMQRLQRDGVAFRLTMNLTPPLCAMLRDELLRARYLRNLEHTIALAEAEIARHREDPELLKLAHFYHDLLRETLRLFRDQWNCDLLAEIRKLRDAGVLEIIASAATHAVLPLLINSPEALRAQILLGCDDYRQNFGAEPAGFWLPECAYSPGLEQIFQEANLRWFILDSHGLRFAKPPPQRSVYAPCFTAAGPAAFARDPESSRQVWSATSGYPGDPVYREFYRDLGFELPPQNLFPGLTNPTPRFTGLKYHRVTGGDLPKEIYRRDWAENAALAHADHFFESRRDQLTELNALIADPIVVMPFDAELFGHWWFEGPIFLEHFIRKVAARSTEMQLITPSDYLSQHPTQEVVAPAASSWGEKGYWGVWLDETNAWMYPHLHAAARRMTEMARAHRGENSEWDERVLRQLARELLLAQASDWPFLIKMATAKEYATRRVQGHLERFTKLYQQLKMGPRNEAFLCECETRDNLFPNLEWRKYL
ncbi:MAG: glycoside hydrolase family 57 protein [Chthoniobacterales bacterium]